MDPVIVVGAGCFGAWTAYELARSGRQVTLLDAYGPGNSRASSGGETRLIRMGYGAQEIYTHWSMRSLGLWKALEARTASRVFHQTGVLWLARDQDPLTTATLAALDRAGVPHEALSRAQLEARWPQIDSGSLGLAILEPHSGVLMARRAVDLVVREAVREGARYATAAVEAPRLGRGRLDEIATRSGDTIAGATFVFACGPWLPTLFPDLLGGRIFVTRQEVLYFGPPPGDARFAPPALPAWIDFGEEMYGVPDIEARGFKISARPARSGVRPRHRRSHRGPHAAGGPRLPRPALPGAPRRAARRRGGVPVREHVQRRFPDRSPSRSGERLAGRRRIRPRLQARPGRRRVRRASGERGRCGRRSLQPRDEGQGPAAGGLLGQVGRVGRVGQVGRVGSICRSGTASTPSGR